MSCLKVCLLKLIQITGRRKVVYREVSPSVALNFNFIFLGVRTNNVKIANKKFLISFLKLIFHFFKIKGIEFTVQHYILNPLQTDKHAII